MKNNTEAILAIAMLMLIAFVGCKETQTQGQGITANAVSDVTPKGPETTTPTETTPTVTEPTPTETTTPTEQEVILDENALLGKIQCSSGVIQNGIYVITQSKSLLYYLGDTLGPKTWKIYAPTQEEVTHLAFFHSIEYKSMLICGKNITIIIDNGEKDPLVVSYDAANVILNDPLIANGFNLLGHTEGLNNHVTRPIEVKT